MALWDTITSSGDVEDRRGQAPSAIGGLGVVGTIIVLGFTLLSGGSVDVQNVLSQLQSQSTKTSSNGTFVDTKNYKLFAQKVLGSNNDIWKKELAKRNIQYKEPKLVLFRGSTQSGCGGADSQTGPHYCPVDKTIYLDETFFEELTNRFGAKGGDVAEGYVIAHEVGHHVQNILSTLSKYDTRDPKISIKTELQADCFAGVWAGDVTSQGVIAADEIEEAVDAASAVGDDRIQKSTSGRVNPETWTHGSSAQRKQWFLTGYTTKDSTKCNTI